MGDFSTTVTDTTSGTTTSFGNDTTNIPNSFSSSSVSSATVNTSSGTTTTFNSAPDDLQTFLNKGAIQVSPAPVATPAPVKKAAASQAATKAAAPAASKDVTDFRIRLRAQPNAQAQVYGANAATNILQPLYTTGGVFFPYTPSITWNQQVEYDHMSFIHGNQDFYAYKNTPSTVIDVNGDFTVQNQQEGTYLLAALHFLRTVSKMYFGQTNTALAGTPPPVLLFSGYGNYMFNDLPVIVKSHTYSLDDKVDYITVTTAGGTARLPAIVKVSISLVVQNTPKNLRTKFDLDKFRTGELMRSGNKGWI